MANFFKTDLGSTEVANLSLEAINKYGDNKLYFRVNSESNYILQPDTKVRALIAPSSASLSASDASGLLVTGKDDNTNGYFYTNGGANYTTQEDILSFNDIEISDISWENQTFRLYWLITRGPEVLYGSNENDIYSLPHNIQGSEVIISGNLIDIDSKMQYRITWNSIQNEGSTDYGSIPNDGPYWINVLYSYSFTRGDYGSSVSGFTSPLFHPSGVMSSGIVFELPFYDPRRTQELPASYKLRIANVTASGNTDIKPGSSILEVELDHGKLLNNNIKSFKSVDEYVFNSPDKSKLVKVKEILIDDNVINRKRLSIGINDISIKENSYVKQGVYISPSYPLDFNIYTFSLRVDEFIPDYPNLNKYDIVKYFVEFNSNKWEQISPLGRKDEINNSVLIPKIFILDKSPQEEIISEVKYIQYNSNINLFRLKIVFDLSGIIDEKFIPPEIRDYKCIIYDKNQFFNL